MYAKIHETGNNLVLGCCEKKLIGKTIEDGDCCLEVKEKFYKDKLVEEKELIELMRKANSINLLGEKPVKTALKAGFIKENDIIKIKKIPHVQIFKI